MALKTYKQREKELNKKNAVARVPHNRYKYGLIVF